MFKKSEPTSPGLIGPIVSSAFTLAIVAGCLIALAFWADGYSAALRTFTSMIMPVGLAWTIGGFLTLWSIRRGRLGGILVFGLFFVAVGLLGNSRISDRLMRSVEWPIEDAADEQLESTIAPPFRTIVVLGGSISTGPDGRFELGPDGERIFTAAQFWHQGRTESIICTGSSVTTEAPSTTGRILLESAGVPAKAIFESPGMNTVEEMQNLKTFFDQPPETFPQAGDGRIGLITSAFHLNRAMRLARAQGFKFTPLPVAYRQGERDNYEVYDWVPTVQNLKDSTTALREWLAYFAGR
ncbi:YdcF family protein [Crateriforma conspicua]|uniref:DUF218 domain-containing protein n=1 Tax=Crateriforma conspicua TaxID=2527996 RepID=A0A5C5Y411_9PLAN|nr:YdcF family protein [Crateriforma conspicua]TWT69549.1 hypothetical protein Pan14r_18370 [Crateriforma conspicua]